MIIFRLAIYLYIFHYMLCSVNLFDIGLYNVVKDVDRPNLCSLADKGCVWKLRH